MKRMPLGMPTPSRIRIVLDLTEIERSQVYMHYFITMLGLKHNFVVVDKGATFGLRFWGLPDKETNLYGYYYLWKDLHIYSRGEFFSDDRIEIKYMGADWRDWGYADNWRIEPHGAYDWYWKFADEIKFI